jgi:hypothetical protein
MKKITPELKKKLETIRLARFNCKCCALTISTQYAIMLVEGIIEYNYPSKKKEDDNAKTKKP